MTIPLVDPKSENHAIREELLAAFEEVLDSGQYILGPGVSRLEKEISEYTGARHAIAVSSGTDALLLALMALEIGPGDEVLCPAFTFFATAGCIARTGATPVFVDVCPVCFNIDTTDAAKKVTAKTRAIIPVHLYGQCADMDAVEALASAHDLFVLEDAAQSLGAKYRGRNAGTIGHFGAFSFYPTKNLGALGDAGMLVTNDGELAEKARILRNHGAEPKYYHKVIGANFRLDEVQAALLSVKMKRLDEYSAARRRNARLLTEELEKTPGVRQADPSHCKCAAKQAKELERDDIRLALPAAYPHNEHVWNQYTIRVLGNGRRDALRKHLSASGIGSEIYYPVPLHEQECFAKLPAGSLRDCEVASRLAGEVLSIPVHPGLQDHDIQCICNAVCEGVKES